jgi:hypothetical protein
MLKKNIIVLFFLLAGLNSCKKDFLEIDPVGKIIAKTVTDYNNLFYNSSLFATLFSDPQIPLSDEVAAVSTYFTPAAVRIQRLFRWEKDIYNEDENSVEFTSLMSQVYLLNKIANEVMNATDGTEADKKALQAEARATRAWSYFMLINYYGKPYNEATAAADPGFPIVTEADAAATSFSRASVKDVYDFIVKDLVESIPLLPLNATVKSRMNKADALTLLGKVYVFMGKYTDALVQLKAVAANMPTNVTLEIYDYNTTLTVGGTWGYSPTVNSYTGGPLPVVSNETMLTRNFNSNFMPTSNSMLLSAEAYALYGTNDQRKKLFTNKANPVSSGVSFPLNMTRKYGYITVVSYGVTYPELFLLLAECKARTNDLTGAKADLETLRVKRMPAGEATVNVTNQEDMIRLVINERRREFALQGYRWFDIRRLSNDPLFANDTYTHTLYDINGAVTATYTMPKDRLVMRLPLKIMAQNTGMTNNP